MLIRTSRFARARARAAALGAVVFATSLVTVAPVASAAPVGPSCNTSAGTVTCTFLPVGTMVPWVVPAGVTSVRALVIGGKGGSSGSVAGGNADFSYGTFSVTPGETLQISVGGNASGSTAGWNGGGAGTAGAGGGGGASDIRRGGSALSNRIIIAGGGGGAGGSTAQGVGGSGGAAGEVGTAGSSATGFIASGGGGGGGLSAGGAGGTSAEPTIPSDWTASPNYDSKGSSGSLGQGGTYTPLFGAPEGGGGGGGGGRYGGGSGAGGKFYTYTGDNPSPPFMFGTGAGGGGGGGASFLNVALTASGMNNTTEDPSITIFYAAPGVAPTISFDPSTVNLQVGATCQATLGGPPPVTVTGTPTPSVTYSPVAGTVVGLGSTIVTGTASNGVSPNAASSYVVVVRDQTPPVITNLPANITVSTTDPAGAVVTYPTPGFVDNCPGGTIVRTQGLASGATFPVGTTTVGYTATDASANPTTRSFTVTVNLVTPPTIGAIADVYETAPTGTCAATVPAPTVTSGGTPLPTVGFSPAMPGVFPVGSTGVTATASNGAPPDATTSFRVVVEDHQSPTLTNLPANITTTATDSAGAVVTFGSPTVGDNCPGASLFQISGPSSGDVFPIGVTTVAFQASDGSNNTTRGSFTVTVQGPPTLAPISNIQVTTDRDRCTASNVAPPSTVVGGTPVPTVSFSPPLAGPFSLGSNPITATASNGIDPPATRTFDVQVVDRQPPILTVPTNITLIATSAAGAVVNYTVPSATDNCDGLVSPFPGTPTAAPGNTFPIGTTGVSWIARDRSGNTGIGFFNVTVLGIAPTLGPIDNQVLWNDANVCSAVGFTPRVTTTGFPVPTVTFSPPMTTSFPVGSTTVTATASNGVSPVATRTFQVIVSDVQGPTLTMPANITVSATSAAGAVVTYAEPTANDNCDGPLTPTRTSGLASGSVFPIGTTTINYEVNGDDGLTADFFTVTVTGAAPTIEPIANIVVPTAIDTCAAAVAQPVPVATGLPVPTVSFSPTWPATFPMGTTPVTATASNGVSPDASTTFPVTVEDHQPPSITVPANIVLTATSAAGAVGIYGAISASDNCAAPTISRRAGPSSGSMFPIGTTTVTYRATDPSGNFAEASFTVTVNGAPPTIASINAITVNADAGVCSAVVAAPTTATTGIPAPTVSFSPPMPGTFPVGSTSVTATATNGIAPDASTSFGVDVVDAQVPSIGAVTDIVVSATSPAGATVTYATPSASDNCPGVTLSRTGGFASGSTFPIGDTIVRFEAKDASNNRAVTTFRVHVAGSSEQISALIGQLPNTSAGRSLKRELVDAQRELARGDLRDACRELESFVWQVKAQRGKKLTRQQADAFVAAAQQIQNVINCRCLPPHRDRDRH